MSDQPSPPPSAAGTAGLATILAALAMLGPFSIDTYLPAFPNIEQSLGASTLEVQQTLSVYMLAFGIMTLWHGALSDAFGRRNIILGWLAVFAVASLGCAAAHSVQYLWAFRILQGVSAGAGIVIGRAIIRDLHAGPAAERLLSLVTMIFSIAPAIAPILGGAIVRIFDWRSIFLFLFAYAVLLLWYCWKRLPESLPPEKRQKLSPRFLFHSYRQVFRSPLFHLKSGTVAFNFAGLFLFISSAPAFITRHLGLGSGDFGWLFIPAVSGVFCGALTANRLAGKLSIDAQVRIGFFLLLGAAGANAAYHLFFPPALPWSVAPLFFYTFGMSIVAPGATLMVLDLFPEIRGIAASCQSSAVTILGAIVAGAVAPVLSRSTLGLAFGQLACAATALTLWLIGRAYRTRMSQRDLNAWESVELD
ncbi:MAG TPA: multidrug effflux MFS transporter [Paucimonas sp.]|nr:multidrug effflux MFS transporter [Paucimonas sp.]